MNVLYKYSWGAVPVLFPLILSAQKQGRARLDSLFTMLPAKQADSSRVKVLKDISFTYYVINPDSGIMYGKQALELAERTGWKEGIAMAANSLASNYVVRSDFSRALRFHQQSLRMSEMLGDEQGQAISLGNIGNVYKDMSDYPEAQRYFLQALKKNEALKNAAGVGFILGDLGMVYRKQRQFGKALEYYMKALEINRRTGNREGVAINLGNIGSVYSDQGNYPKAEEYLQQALDINKANGNKNGIAVNLGNLGLVYQGMGAFHRALEHFRDARKVNAGLGDLYGVTINTGNIGKLYLYLIQAKKDTLLRSAGMHGREELLQASAGLLQEAVKSSRRLNDKDMLQDYLQSLSAALALKKDYRVALQTYQQHILYRDSVFNAERNIEFSRQEIQYEYEKKENALRFRNELQKAEVHLLRQHKELASARLRQQWLYTVTGIIILTLIGSYFFYRYRIRELRLRNVLAQEKADQELKEAEYNRRMNDMAFMALRAQMNPHFIFNCLNSIKLYTEQNDSEAASEYLTRFARLIRSMLDNARAECILLTAEIETLKLYLGLEAMRFKEKLRYHLEVDAHIDTEFIEIPPLLIQPYVENAVWHGLMHKEEGGHIFVNISQPENSPMLTITVEDNGIGREKAAALRSRKAANETHRSHGTALTGERIRLINEKYNAGAQVIITDLQDSDGHASGTLVTIQLPVK